MIQSIFNSLFFFFDQIIYGFIPTLYNFINVLANQTLFSGDTLQNIADNIYAVLGVFMLFRVAFILLNAIIDPEKLTDKEKGIGKMLSRLVTALVLIVVIPWAFTFAFRLQSAILSNMIVQKIVIGTGQGSQGDPGQQMGRIALESFLTCNPNASTSTTTCQDELKTGFDYAFPGTGTGDFKTLSDHLNDKDSPVSSASGGDVYKYSYSAGLSTVCGVFILGLLIVFSFDIAVRVVKLGFLQLITPIAVVGYIEPKSSKRDIFGKWLGMCISTYINLFVRLLAISFVVLIIASLDDIDIFKDPITGAGLTGTMLAFVKIFIIIGALMFAKEAPKMLSSMFGLDEGSMGSLNPFKKLSGMAGAGIIGGATALGMKGVAGIGGGISGAISSSRRGGNAWAGAKQGASSAAGGISMKGGFNGMGKRFGGLATSWHKGATAGATGAVGKDTKVGIPGFLEQRKNVTTDQQTRARNVSASRQLAETEKQIKSIRSKYGSATDASHDDELFGKTEFANKFKDFTADSKVAKDAQNEYDAQLQLYNSELTDGKSAVYWANTGLQQAKINKAAAAAAGNAADEALYGSMEATYKSDLDKASKYYTNAKDVLKKANDKLEVSKNAFEAEKKLSTNAEHLDKLNQRSELKNMGRI